MAYPNRNNAAPRPFDWRAFPLRLNGNMAPGCSREPSGLFVPANGKNKGFNFVGYFNHPSVPKGFSQSIGFKEMANIINYIRYIANAPGEEKFAKALGFKYFANGEHRFNGVRLMIGRNDEGLISFCFVGKNIPTIQFPLNDTDSMVGQTTTGEPDDVRFTSRIAALSLADYLAVMYQDHLTGSIEDTVISNEPQPTDNNETSNDVASIF